MVLSVLGAGPGEAIIDDTAFIQLIYNDVLDRPTDAEGQAAWLNALDSGLLDRRGAARNVLGSLEYEGRVVQSLYLRLLGRAGDSGVSGYVDSLQHGVIREQVMASILGSAEYFATRGGGTDSGFLAALYQDVLHRGIDSTGVADFGALLASGVSRADVALLLLQSREARALLIGNLYEQLLLRTAEAAGLEAWLAFLAQGGTVEDIIAGILASEEYANLDRTNPLIGSTLLDPFGVPPGGTSSSLPASIETLLDSTSGPGGSGQSLAEDGQGVEGTGVATTSTPVAQPQPLMLVASGLVLLLAYRRLGSRRARRGAIQRTR